MHAILLFLIMFLIFLLQTKKKDEAADLFASRRMDSLQVREAKKIDEERRRESLAGRNRQAKVEREQTELLQQIRKEEEQRLLEFRYDSWKDASAEREAHAKRSRDSMAFRLDSWRNQRSVDSEQTAQEQEVAQLEFEMRHDDWLELQRYKTLVSEKSRQSVAGRLEQWRQERRVDETQRTQEQAALELELELRQQELADLAELRAVQAMTRRMSLAHRLDKAREDRTVEEGVRAAELLLQEEERRLALLDHQAMHEYKRTMQQVRRQSLEYRNQIAVRENSSYGTNYAGN